MELFSLSFFSNRTKHSPGDSILKNTAYGTCKSTPLYKWQITRMLFGFSKQEKYINTEHAHRRVQIMSKWTYLPPSFNFHSSNKDKKCIAPENIKCPKKFVDGNFSLSFVCKPPIVCALSKRSVKSLRIGPIELANTQFFRHYSGCDRRINIHTSIIMQFLLLNFKRKINVDILNIN